MKMNDNEHIVLFDTDGTLILENYKDYPKEQWVEFNYYGNTRIRVPHKEQIELLKSYKKRGFFIRVHSNNGKAWVEEVITKLNLTEYVDSGEAKACKFVDDEKLPSNGIMGQHVFIPPEKP